MSLQFLQTGGHGVAYAMVILSLVGALGLAIGNLGARGVKLGIGGALFSGIAFAHFGVSVDASILEFAREFGLILFVYSIGIQVGPGFFSSLRKNGLLLNGFAASIVILGVLVCVGIHMLADMPLPVVLGLFSGATTNTPSLAAAQQVLAEVNAEGASNVLGMAYAVAYPFGIVGILLTMLVIRFFLRININHEADHFEEQRRASVVPVDTLNIAITNKNLEGLTLREIPGFAGIGVILSRLLHDGQQTLAHPEHVIAMGDVVLAVGPKNKLTELKLILGEESPLNLKKLPSDVRWERMVVTNSKILGKSLAEVNFRTVLGVTISRVVRSGVELVPNAALHLQFGDILTVIGEPAHIESVSAVVGNKSQMLQHAQIMPIFIGIALGVFIGSIPLQVPGMPAALKLGLAGGPLIVAIILSRLGNIGPLVWFMPPSANAVLREIGIILFLACVGLKSGGQFMDTLINGDGLLWMWYGALITLIPLLIVGFVARIIMKSNYLILCGVLAGSMTDPPALAFANGIHPTSEAPALAYATVYPLTMFLRVMSPQILVLLFYA